MCPLRLIRRSLSLILVSLLMLGAESCGTSKSVSGKDARVVDVASRRTDKKDAKSSKPIDTKGLDGVTAALLDEASSWRGTPYLYGGNTRDGVDCSGFVLQVYKRALDISLPRTSRDQQQYCTPVDKRHLVPGDLVFFATTSNPARVSHVGIYIGGNRMIHSSSSKGVVESDLGTDYYTSHYYGAGRVERFHTLAAKADASKTKTDKKQSKQSSQKKQKSESKVTASVRPDSKKSKERSESKAGKQSKQSDVSTASTATAQRPIAKSVRQSAARTASTATDEDPQSLRQRVLSGLPDK